MLASHSRPHLACPDRESHTRAMPPSGAAPCLWRSVHLHASSPSRTARESIRSLECSSSCIVVRNSSLCPDAGRSPACSFAATARPLRAARFTRPVGTPEEVLRLLYSAGGWSTARSSFRGCASSSLGAFLDRASFLFVRSAVHSAMTVFELNSANGGGGGAVRAVQSPQSSRLNFTFSGCVRSSNVANMCS
jgi:hypothetical protein